MATFKSTNRRLVNDIEITYDEIRVGAEMLGFDGVAVKPKETHYYLNGVKVCTDGVDQHGNNRHYQDLPIQILVDDDGVESEVTNTGKFFFDTCECKGVVATHFFNGGAKIYDIEPCEYHSQGTKKEQIEACIYDNDQKNQAINAIFEKSESLKGTYLKDSGELVTAWKPNCEPKWEFDAERNLKITLPESIDAQEKAQIEAELPVLSLQETTTIK